MCSWRSQWIVCPERVFPWTLRGRFSGEDLWVTGFLTTGQIHLLHFFASSTAFCCPGQSQPWPLGLSWPCLYFKPLPHPHPPPSPVGNFWELEESNFFKASLWEFVVLQDLILGKLWIFYNSFQGKLETCTAELQQIPPTQLQQFHCVASLVLLMPSLIFYAGAFL